MNHTEESKGGRLLVVEDESRQRELLKSAISDMGYDVRVAESGEDALRLLERNAFHIGVVDLNLPGMSGLDFIETVHPSRPMMQFIVLTGYGDLNAARRAIHQDVADFLTKPCPLDDLEDAIGRAWKKHVEVVNATASEARRIQDVERDMIMAALLRHGDNRSAAARELGISVRTLYYRLAQYEAEDRMKRSGN